MASILLVEDDESFRDILKLLLTKAGFQTDVAEGGKTARHILGIKAYDLVITDMRMSNGDGLELLQWIKKERSMPVVMMTGFQDLIETQTAHEGGADAFLPKPFQQDELLRVVGTCLNKGKPVEQEKKKAESPVEEEEFCKVSIDEFVMGKTIPYNIYLKLTDDKYVKVAYQGEDITTERIKSYKGKNVNFLYLKKQDFEKYVGLNLRLGEALKSASNISKEKKKSFLKHAGEVIMEKVHVNGVDSEGFKDAAEFIDTTLSIMADDKSLLDLLGALNNHSDFLYAHSLGVSLYSVMIAKKIGWKASPTVFKVSMSGLFHDIGKKEIDRAVLEKSRVVLSAEERTVIETHSQRGAEILSLIKSIPAEVAQVAYQHHEDCNGYGFPLGLTKKKINPLARLVSVANIFCEYAIKGPHSEGLPAKEAISQMIQFRGEGLDPDFFNALQSIFNLRQ